ncbi:MAG TPA: hypothetical protein VF550_18220 [Polyangia bacterium]
MSSQVSRHFYSIAAATLVLTAGMSRTAVAKDCTTDSDCDAGYQCNLAPVGGGTSGAGGSTGISTPGTEASPPVPAPDLPVPVPTDGGIATLVADAGVRTPTSAPDAGLPTVPPIIGTCEPKPIVCTSVADCPADFECVKDMIAVSQPPCPANTKCATPPPQTSDTGTCNAVPHACSTATDCPAPLVCQAQSVTCSGGGSVGSDGVVTTTPEICTQGIKVCTYVPKSCTADNECASSYQCVKVSEGGSCTASAGACTRSDAGTVCSTPDPPVCTSYVVMNCLPKQIACGAGQACPSGWSCFDDSNLSGSIPGWTADASGRSCLPDGLILAVGGHAANGGSTVTNTSGTAGGDSGSAPTISIRGDAGLDSGTNSGAPTGVAPGPTGSPSADPAAPGSDTSGTKEGTGTTPAKAHGGGCALGGGHPDSTNLWLALALAGLVVRVARRRSSGRQ